jgi:hypothetical protein
VSEISGDGAGFFLQTSESRRFAYRRREEKGEKITEMRQKRRELPVNKKPPALADTISLDPFFVSGNMGVGSENGLSP